MNFRKTTLFNTSLFSNDDMSYYVDITRYSEYRLPEFQ